MGCRITTVVLPLLQMFDYNGGRTLDDLIKYVEGQLEGKVMEEEEESERRGRKGEGVRRQGSEEERRTIACEATCWVD